MLLGALCVMYATGAAAQNVYGSLVGNVTDSSGGAIPGATVTATQTETNLTREVVTNASGAYSIPNIPSGTYQVVVAVPGFQTFTARDVIVTNRDVRVDAKLGLGTLEEALTVTATAAILQTENAAVQHIANSEQLQTLPTSGRAFQSFMTLMPGVADPNYQQSGGINNPGRTMSLTINGQPATNTVVRLDGITATNQFFESIQSYGPSLEAIETVNVVTSSFDADQGMAGAAAVNVQVKTGTNNFRGSAFEYVDRRADARAQLLPAGRSRQGHVERARVRRHAGRPDRQEQAVLLLQRRDDAPADVQRQRRRGRPAPTASSRCRRPICAAAISRAPATVIYDPLTGQSDDRRRPRAVCVRELSGSDVDDRPALRVVQLHSGEPHQSDRGGDAREAGAADAAGLHEQLFRHQRVRHDLSQDRREGHLQPGSEAEPQRPPRVPAELGALAGHSAVGRRSAVNPLSQGRVWDSFVDSHSIGATIDSVAELRGRRLVRLHEAQRQRVSAGRHLLRRRLRHSECLPAAVFARHERAEHERARAGC